MSFTIGKGRWTVVDATGFIADCRTAFPVHAADEECLADAVDQQQESYRNASSVCMTEMITTVPKAGGAKTR